MPAGNFKSRLLHLWWPGILTWQVLWTNSLKQITAKHFIAHWTHWENSFLWIIKKAKKEEDKLQEFQLYDLQITMWLTREESKITILQCTIYDLADARETG